MKRFQVFALSKSNLKTIQTCPSHHPTKQPEIQVTQAILNINSGERESDAIVKSTPFK